MVSPAMESAVIYNVKLSSVGPGHATCPDSVFEPGDVDLAMKLHYLSGVYYFGREAFDGLSTLDIKEPMFEWLDRFPVMCGRFRRAESGRAYIKCNDCGVRFVEARCDRALDDWLLTVDATSEKLLTYDHLIGPELSFSPLVYLQLTKFKCGGAAVGLSWAHVLGDAFSTAEFLKVLGRVVSSGSKSKETVNLAQTLKRSPNPSQPTKAVEDPISIKRVDPVGDKWVHVTTCKIESFSFNVTANQLSQLRSRLTKNGVDIPPFEAITAIIWQCVARVRVAETDTGIVTICKKGKEIKSTCESVGNNQVISVVKADYPVVEANPSELARLLQNEASNENNRIEKVMERENGLPDFIIYGANLTFVNFEGAEFYEFEYRGQKPIRVSYKINGVGDKGAVLVLQGPKEDGKISGGRLVTVMLPENETMKLKSELKKEGLIA